MSNVNQSRFYPRALDGEFILGTYARWARVSFAHTNSCPPLLGTGAKKSAVNDVSGKWICALQALLGINFTENEALLAQSTMQPLYNSFFSDDKRVIGRLNGSFSVNTEIAFRYLRLCPICIEHDLQELGITYWRTFHQSPLLRRCPQHNSKLVPLIGEVFKLSNPCSIEINHVVTSRHFKPDFLSFEEQTPFQQWVETLQTRSILLGKKNLANIIIETIKTQLDWECLIGNESIKRKLGASQNTLFLEAFKRTGYEDWLVRGSRSLSELKDDSRISLHKLLRHKERYSPLLYLLLGWVFLGIDKMNEIFKYDDLAKAS